MSITSTGTRSTFRILAVALLIAVAALTITDVAAKPAAAAEDADDVSSQACELWALTDRVDGQGRVYGAGGVMGCGRVAGLRASLYRDGVNVSNTRISDCFSPCSVSTGPVSIGSGQHTWCTIIRVYVAGSEENKTHCAVY